MTTSMKFSQYQVVLAHEQVSFWQKNMIAIVILLQVLARMSKQLLLEF